VRPVLDVPDDPRCPSWVSVSDIFCQNVSRSMSRRAKGGRRDVWG
jgi:hypothetical protein